MLGKQPPRSGQEDLFKVRLEGMCNPSHELVKLAKRFPWDDVEQAFAGLYGKKGHKSLPVRLAVGLLLLKHLENLSDEVVVERWRRDPYMQYFCGEEYFQWDFPCHPTALVHFRKRIGAEGMELILKATIQMQAEEVDVTTIVVDSTVQEKDIAPPRDVVLLEKSCRALVRLAKRHGVALPQTYEKERKRLKMVLRTRNFPRAKQRARRATKRMRTITGRLMRSFQRRFPGKIPHSLNHLLGLVERVIKQRPKDSGKVFALHEPDVYCVAKGKDHKMYEFGSKVSIAMTPDGLVVGALNHATNVYDGHAVPDVHAQIVRLTGQRPVVGIGDQGYRVKADFPMPTGFTMITTAELQKKRQSDERRSWVRELARKRSHIEPIIGHIKFDHRMWRSFYKGIQGDEINALLAAAAWNLRRWMRRLCAFRYLVIQLAKRLVTERDADHRRSHLALAA